MLDCHVRGGDTKVSVNAQTNIDAVSGQMKQTEPETRFIVVSPDSTIFDVSNPRIFIGKTSGEWENYHNYGSSVRTMQRRSVYHIYREVTVLQVLLASGGNLLCEIRLGKEIKEFFKTEYF